MQEKYAHALEFLMACQKAGIAAVRCGDLEATFHPPQASLPNMNWDEESINVEMPDDLKRSFKLE